MENSPRKGSVLVLYPVWQNCRRLKVKIGGSPGTGHLLFPSCWEGLDHSLHQACRNRHSQASCGLALLGRQEPSDLVPGLFIDSTSRGNPERMGQKPELAKPLSKTILVSSSTKSCAANVLCAERRYETQPQGAVPQGSRALCKHVKVLTTLTAATRGTP